MQWYESDAAVANANWVGVATAGQNVRDAIKPLPFSCSPKKTGRNYCCLTKQQCSSDLWMDSLIR